MTATPGGDAVPAPSAGTVPDPLGAPWQRRLQGRLDRLVIDSEVLAGNPLGDPTRRPVYVYTPPGYDESSSYPSIYVLQGMTGQLDMWLNRSAFEPTMVERVDALLSGDCPPAVVVFVDAWTSYGGSQFVNSPGTGRYMDYVCDEVVAFVDERYATAAEPERRGITGKSSGGYGAMVLAMLRADVFGALASHAGDALFEACYLPEFPQTARILRDRFEGSFDVFFDKMRVADHFDFSLYGHPLNSYAMAACYSADADGTVRLPFDVATAMLVDEIWGRWLAWDPVRLVPEHLDELSRARLIYLDAGRSDEYYLDLGAQAVSRALGDAGIEHRLELFEGRHGGIQYRYPIALRALAQALSA